MDLKDFNIQHWWKLMAGAGGIIAAASIVPKSTLGFLVGLSLLFFGLGEWINRPRKAVKETVEGVAGFKIVDDYPWKASILGLILEGIGVLLFVLTIYLVVVMAQRISN